MTSFLYFLLLVGVLVTIHEFGHYLAAKLLDIKVLRFSIGFGRPLLRWRGPETEYQLSIFPIGGYVRILGEDLGDEGDADSARSFQAQALWRRLVVVFSGPAANLVLPVFIYFLFFAGHRELPAAVIGDVIDAGPAARAGLEAGDHILSIDGQSMRYWEELESKIANSAGRELRVVLRRGDKDLERYIVPVETPRRREDAMSRLGQIGITRAPFVPLIGVIDATSPAGRAGLRTGDLIVSIDGLPIGSWGDVRRHLGTRTRRTNVIYLRGTEVPGLPQIRLLEPGLADLVPEPSPPGTKAPSETAGLAGLEPAEMFVSRVAPGTPADLAGLRPGDLIVSLDGETIRHWMTLEQLLFGHPDRAFRIGWLRAEQAGPPKAFEADVRVIRRQESDEYGHAVERLVFGAQTDYERGRGVMTPIDGRFGYALRKAVDRTGETIGAMVSSFWSILSGKSPDEMGGPLTMYRVATVSGQRGWDSFLLMLALISVNLGLINLLPIPMLDGGHLVVVVAEMIQRKPLSHRARGRLQLAGLVIVGLITILALRNDLVRYVLD